MKHDPHVIGLELGIFIALFLLVAGLGFAAVRWRRVEKLASIDEWGLGGRSFGAFISWFLIGGDLYTAYTFIAIPALLYGAGELGFFAVPYTIIVYPLVFGAGAGYGLRLLRQGPRVSQDGEPLGSRTEGLSRAKRAPVMGPDLAESLQRAAQQGRLPAGAVPLGEGIRATVLGASQFSVQLSGNTVHISDPAVLPLRNLPVVYARLDSSSPDAASVAQAIRHGFVRMDLLEGEHPAAIALPWRGEPHYDNLRALADGIAQGMPRSLAAGFPLVITLDGDIGASLGGILHEELDVVSPLVSIDGLQLVELDYVDIGEIIQPANVVPVVVKSLAFSSSASHGAGVVRP